MSATPPTDQALFDLDLDEPADDNLDLRDNGSAYTSCRYCQTLTTVDGLDNRDHGPDHGYAGCDHAHALSPADCPAVQR